MIEAKPATAARIYDYYLGGTHNFPADREAAEKALAVYPLLPAVTRTNRAFLGRAIRFLVGQDVRQFLDIGSGIPTEGNVHEVVDAVIEDGRVVYIDIDPVAVAEGMDILEGNPRAIAIYGDLSDPQPILDNPQVRALLDFRHPIALLLGAVLHFVPDDRAFDAVATIVRALPSGSYVVISHAVPGDGLITDEDESTVKDTYKRQTTTALALRPRAGVSLFFDGLEMVEPGLVWVPQWRPDPADPQEFATDPRASLGLVGVGRKP